MCHSEAGGNKGGLNFETYENVIANLADIKNQAVTLKKMPPRKPLTSDLTSILSSWIGAGAPKTLAQ